MKPRQAKEFTCVECGKVFASRYTMNAICCSRSCNAKHGHRVHGYHSKSTEMSTCTHCGKEYHPKSRDRNKFCSRECAYEHRKATPKTEWDRNGTCSICGKAFVKKVKTSKICSRECKLEYGRRRQNENRGPWVGKVREAICVVCGKAFVPYQKRTKTCSDKCLRKKDRQSDGARQSRKAHKARREMVKRGAYVEPVSLRYLIERDNGRCQICGKKVSIKPVPHPKAATIDHIIPLAKGGKHEAKNCQLAHFECNWRKRDAPIGQQRLCG